MSKKHIFSYLFILSFLTVQPFTIRPVYAQQLTREQLEAQLKAVEAEIAQHKNDIAQKQKEGASLSRDISILGSKISQSLAKIKSQTTKITSLNGEIQDKVESIKFLSAKTEQQKKELAQILRRKNELDTTTIVEFALSEKTLSEFFVDQQSYLTLQSALNSSVNQLITTKSQTEEAKTGLEDKKDQETYLKTLQEIEKQKTQTAQNQKSQILKVTKGQEAQYKKVLADREKEAAKIRTALFALSDGSSIQFGTLYDFARRAGGATGVSPSFIMAILSQETNLGKNTGQCYLQDEGGTLVSISSGAARGEMRPNSIQPFLSITKAVGRDTFKTKVSCAYQGYGGAMGIAQFMPATWMSYKSRIEGIVGSYANPWNNFHAVTAAAIYLSDLGASGSNDSANRNAACKYYSGRNCSSSSAGAGYGNSVLRKQAEVQAQIDILQGN